MYWRIPHQVPAGNPAKLPRKVPVDENLAITLLALSDTNRFPLLSNAMPVGVPEEGRVAKVVAVPVGPSWMTA